MILDKIGEVVRELMDAGVMQYTARHVASWSSSVVTVASSQVAQNATGIGQGVGVVGTVVGIAGMLLPLVFKERSEKRAEKARERQEAMAHDAEKEALRKELEASARRIAELEKQSPLVEANRQGLIRAEVKADAAFEFLRKQGWISDINDAIPAVQIRVLVVEDHVPTGRALVRFLGEHGFATDYASSAADAIGRLSGPIPFDWLTLDLAIDDGKGEDVLAFVRRMRLSTRVAVTTGTPEPGRIAALKPLKPDHIFIKPVNWTSLIETLRSDPVDDPGPGTHDDAGPSP